MLHSRSDRLRFDQAKGMTTSLLDERIDYHQSMDWTYGRRVMRTPFHGAQYKGIANTIVQLIRRPTSGLIAASRPIRSDQQPLKGTALAL